jgi:hypothetical protein
MAARADFGTRQLFLTDSRLVLAVANHLRYKALNRVFGVSREQANLVTVVLLLAAADGAYEGARRIGAMHMGVSGGDAAVGAIALREAALGVAGPNARAIPGFGTLVALAILGGAAAPGLRRTAHRMRGAEQRLRRARIRRYAVARDHLEADTRHRTAAGT